MTVLKSCVSVASSLITTRNTLDVSRTDVVDNGQKGLIMENNNSPALRSSSRSPLHNNRANTKFSCYPTTPPDSPTPSLNGSISNGSIPNGTIHNGSVPNGSIPNGYTSNSSISNGSASHGSLVNGHINKRSNHSSANGYANGYVKEHTNGHINSFASSDPKLTFKSNLRTSQPSQQPYERWVRPLGYAERCMTRAHDFGCMTTVYSLWLDSRVPVDFNVIQEAAHIMYRKMPNLRMRLNRRNGKLWWKETSDASVDVKQLVTENIEESVESLLQQRYNMEESPLWFVRFVTLKNDNDKLLENSTEFAHKYVCIFGFHHNASDGTSNMKFCDVFLKVLNDLVQGKQVDMKQEGIFATPLQDALGDELHTIWFFISVFFRRLYTAILTFGISVRNFTRLYKMPCTNRAATRILQHELDEITTKKFIKRCKMEGVTLNSAFTAAANLALYKMMTNRDKQLNETNIWSQQAINMRRYWPKNTQLNALGCHISLLDISFPTQQSDLNAFWEYARDINKRLSYMLVEERRPLKLQPMSERLNILIRHNSWLAWLGWPSANDNHYTVTNMGNLHTTFPGTGEVIEASKVLRSVSCHFMPSLCQHTLQTFRGRFCYSLDYYTQKFSKETATTYAQGIMDLLRYSIHSPN